MYTFLLLLLKEICLRGGHLAPEFQGVDRDRFDINQGEIQNSWLMSALANLAENKEYFRKVVPQGQSFCDQDYAGIFRFRFYRFVIPNWPVGMKYYCLCYSNSYYYSYYSKKNHETSTVGTVQPQQSHYVLT